MKRIPGLRHAMFAICVACVCLAIYTAHRMRIDSPSAPVAEKIRSTSSPHASVESKIARDEYFFRMLRDPATNRIPPGIRRRELAYARTLPKRSDFGGMTVARGKALQGVPGFDWQEVGPFDVGGRTRALAVDRTDTNTIIAGGVSGGIWKSTDGGANWALKTAMTDPLSVTWLAQDPRPGQDDTWYYVTGEFRGNSAGDFSAGASFFGGGVYKSTDNGETWLFLQSTTDVINDPTNFDSPFDFISKIVISPTTGTLFIASNGFGILRSADAGANFSLVLGGNIAHQWSDVGVSSDGTLLAVVSESSSGGAQLGKPGVFRSTDDGLNWENITPLSFPGNHDRSVIAMAPSNPDVAYILTNTGDFIGGIEDVRLHKVTSISGGNFSDRSNNIPDFGGPVGRFDTQVNYNMAVAVKPDDENFVFIGGTNLFRSRDGFLTKSTDPVETWVGGYDSTSSNLGVFIYANQHPDQHVIVFNPQNPNVMWAGHDGGVSRGPAVGAAPMRWQDKNQGYNVTQFYTVALPADSADTRVIGGTQDNGSPFFDWTAPSSSSDKSSGDGAFAFIGRDFLFTSSQQGRVLRVRPDLDITTNITPAGTVGQLFIHPFAVDPTDQDVMYYPEQEHFWRNDSLGSIPVSENVTLRGWTELENIGSGFSSVITAVSVSASNPPHRLYFGSFGGDATPPRLFRLDNANVALDGEEEISIPNLPDGAYIHNIAINPLDANEILVVLSNYNIIGLYHSSNGGRSYTAVEGNLAGNDTNGPSLRWAAILPRMVTHYLIGTSVGLFSTVALDGGNTMWVQEGSDVIGNAVVSSIAARVPDATVAVGTHGRGIFIGDERNETTGIITNTSTLNFAPGDGSQTTVTFLSGTVTGHSVAYQYHGTASPSVFMGEPPPSIPVQNFTISTSIPEGTAFEAALTVTYTDAQLSHANITDESTLKLFRFNDADSTWRQLTTTVDAAANTATTITTSFSAWSLASAIPTGIEDTEGAQGPPLTFALNQNYPNPFNPATTIRYAVPEQAPVRLVVYNITGQRVRTLVDAEQPAGQYAVTWNGRNDQGRQVASGVYFYRLTAGDHTGSKRMTLLR